MTVVKIYRSEITGKSFVVVTDTDKPDLYIFGYGSKETKYFPKDPVNLLLNYINKKVKKEWGSLKK